MTVMSKTRWRRGRRWLVLLFVLWCTGLFVLWSFGARTQNSLEWTLVVIWHVDGEGHRRTTERLPTVEVCVTVGIDIVKVLEERHAEKLIEMDFGCIRRMKKGGKT